MTDSPTLYRLSPVGHQSNQCPGMIIKSKTDRSGVNVVISFLLLDIHFVQEYRLCGFNTVREFPSGTKGDSTPGSYWET